MDEWRGRWRYWRDELGNDWRKLEGVIRWRRAIKGSAAHLATTSCESRSKYARDSLWQAL